MHEGFLKNWEEFYNNLCHGLVTSLSNIIEKVFRFSDSPFFKELASNAAL